MPKKSKVVKKTKGRAKPQPLPKSVQALLKYLGGSDVKVGGGARGGQPAQLAPTSINIAVSQQQAQQQQQQDQDQDQVKVHEADQVTQAAVLSLNPSTQSLGEWSTNSPSRSWLLLSGPEGGLTDEEDALARSKGFAAVHLGDRVLRAETAALAAMAYFSVRE